MFVEYYKNSEITYCSRKRYRNISILPFNTEEQKSVLLGDGSTTTIKTSVENICDYVIIDGTRWFVVYYTYLNGKQVTLHLQRDVIGEFGLDNCFGKIERGYTDSFIKYRKELSLNQILKNRKKLIPESNSYLNYSVDNHNNELWGIFYIVKPTGINPETGEKYDDVVNINIPGFSIETVDYDFIENNTRKIISSENSIKINISFNVNVFYYFNAVLKIKTSGSYWSLSVNVQQVLIDVADVLVTLKNENGDLIIDVESMKEVIKSFCNDFYSKINSGSFGFKYPKAYFKNDFSIDYNNIVIKKEESYLKYTTKTEESKSYGTNPNSEELKNYVSSYKYSKNNIVGTFVLFSDFDYDNSFSYYEKVYSYKELTASEAGIVQIDTRKQLIDEPYIAMVIPLYDVNITGSDKTYAVERSKAFMLFNTLIQYMSGDNGYLVDAQVYPYCPQLVSVANEFDGIPLFSILSGYYEHNIKIQLLPYSDVKKEYICREYSIIPPEQSSKFTFNFYDYVNEIDDNNGINYSFMNIVIKTALKPFSIVSSAVIIPTENSLKGITYNSDLRGCKPSGNGFECSLSTNAFQNYVRNNSNYKQMFDLEVEQLQVQHNVERVNDAVSTVVNTASATAMGAIAGGAAADAGIASLFGSKSAGAAVGGVAAGATVGAAMTAQSIANEKLRDYEKYIQNAKFNLEIGTIKNLPNSVSRVSSFNEIMLRDFWFVIETYDCSDEEKQIVDNFIGSYSYSIGVFDFILNYYKEGWFIKSSLLKSKYTVNLHEIANKELNGGIYMYEQI